MRLLKRGCRGNDVLDIQGYLDDLGYKIQPTSVYDTSTILCVQGFQSHTGLRPDGVVGDLTRAKIKQYNAKNYCPEVFEPILDNIEEVSCYDMEKYLLKYKLSGLSWAFKDAAGEHRVNILHIIAHAILESDWGRSYIATRKFNLFGYKAYDSSPYVSAGKFKSYGACIMDWAEWWKEYYLVFIGKYYNGNCEAGVNVRYATSPVAGVNKAFIVKDLRKKLEGVK